MGDDVSVGEFGKKSTESKYELCVCVYVCLYGRTERIELQGKEREGKGMNEITSFGGRAMAGVLRAISLDHLVVSGVTTQRELDLDDVVARLHQHEDALHLLLLVVDAHAALHVLHQLVLHHLARPVEEVLDHVEELGVGARRHVGQPLGNHVVGVASAGLSRA